jgi:hypothetical protein
MAYIITMQDIKKFEIFNQLIICSVSAHIRQTG